jgi:hypothetical protein
MPDADGSFDRSIDAAPALMDRYGVVSAITMSPPRTKNVRQNFDYPDFLPSLARHPDRFSFLAGGGSLNHEIHSMDAADVTEAVGARFGDDARAAITNGALGFGEMGSLHISLTPQHKYSYAPADHPLMLRLADVAAERDVPIDLHMDAVV